MTYCRILPPLFLIAALFLSCQHKPRRIGMPEHFNGEIPDTFTVVSYNVENFFDLVDNGDEYPEYKPNSHNWTNSMYQTKCSNIASVLAQINADIAILVEVENENAVSGLRAALAERKCGYPYYALGGHANSGSTMPVVMSKLPILSEHSLGISNNATAHDRNILEADIYLGRDTLAVFACHWPSKLHKESTRLANADALAHRLSQLPRGKDYIVAGDFNEDYDECETFHTAGFDDTKGVTGINHVLGTARSAPGKFLVFHAKWDLPEIPATRFSTPGSSCRKPAGLPPCTRAGRKRRIIFCCPVPVRLNRNFLFGQFVLAVYVERPAHERRSAVPLADALYKKRACSRWRRIFRPPARFSPAIARAP